MTLFLTFQPSGNLTPALTPHSSEDKGLQGANHLVALSVLPLILCALSPVSLSVLCTMGLEGLPCLPGCHRTCGAHACAAAAQGLARNSHSSHYLLLLLLQKVRVEMLYVNYTSLKKREGWMYLMPLNGTFQNGYYGEVYIIYISPQYFYKATIDITSSLKISSL